MAKFGLFGIPRPELTLNFLLNNVTPCTVIKDCTFIRDLRVKIPDKSGFRRLQRKIEFLKSGFQKYFV